MPETAPLLATFDTASDTAGVCLSRGNSLLAEATWASYQSHSRQLLPALEWLLQQASCTKDDLGAIGVCLGPGSYAGMRVGISTAKALAYALEAPVLGIDRLVADAYPLAQATDRAVVAFQVAGRAEIAWGVYRGTEAGIATLTVPRLGPRSGPDGFTAAVPPGAIVVGETEKLDEETRATLEEKTGATLIEAAPNRVVAVARLVTERLARGEIDNTDTLVPLYLRAPAIGPQSPR